MFTLKLITAALATSLAFAQSRAVTVPMARPESLTMRDDTTVINNPQCVPVMFANYRTVDNKTAGTVERRVTVEVQVKNKCAYSFNVLTVKLKYLDKEAWRLEPNGYEPPCIFVTDFKPGEKTRKTVTLPDGAVVADVLDVYGTATVMYMQGK